MPNGDVAPGWVLPIWGLGHHHDAASPSAGGRSVMSVPMNGSTDSITADPAWERPYGARVFPALRPCHGTLTPARFVGSRSCNVGFGVPASSQSEDWQHATVPDCTEPPEVHMTVRLNPYLSLKDNAREAMEFYQSVLGGELLVNTFAEYGASEDPAEADKVMHGMLEAPNGLTLMGADTPNGMEYVPAAGVSVSLSGDDESVLRGFLDGLAEGGTVNVPMEKAPWGDTFGMLTDHFGIDWMVNVTGTPD